MIVGFASVGPSRDERGIGELYAIYVEPDQWSTGAGRALIERAEERLRHAYGEATLWVLEDNPRARAFYERGGWQRTAMQGRGALGRARTGGALPKRLATASRSDHDTRRQRRSNVKHWSRGRELSSPAASSQVGTQRTSSTSFWAHRLAARLHPVVAHLLARPRAST